MKINKLALIIAATVVSSSAFAGHWPGQGGQGGSELITDLQLPGYGQDNIAVIKTDSSSTAFTSIYQSSLGSTGGSSAKIDLVDVAGSGKASSNYTITQLSGTNKAKIQSYDGYTDYYDNKVAVVQSGSNNETLVILDGGTDRANVFLNSSGVKNDIKVELNQGNSTTIVGNASGDNNDADIYVSGSPDFANNTIYFNQTGDLNHLDVDVVNGSYNNLIGVDQFGDGSKATAYVNWTDNSNIYIQQTSNDVATVSLANSSNISAVIIQH